jgi:hypothetical protein
VKFKISRHSGHAAPAEALDLLWPRLEGNNHRDVRFDRPGNEIRATWKGGVQTSVERKVREEIARRAVFDLLCEICDGSPELKSDWYAVSPLR